MAKRLSPRHLPPVAGLVLLVACVVTFGYAKAGYADRPQKPSCADWKQRAAMVRKAVALQLVHNREYRRAMPWFYRHCRFLTEQELEVRKANDPTTFVCDTMKGRPAGLTPKFVREHRAPSRNVDLLKLWDEEQRTHVVATNKKCAAEDPLSLSWDDEPDPEDKQASEPWIVAKMTALAEAMRAPKTKPKTESGPSKTSPSEAKKARP
jgi:hypothetical protein